MEKIAIIDICGTIFKSNTTFDFLSNNYPKFKQLSGKKMLCIFNTILIKLFNYDAIRAFGIRMLKGKHKDQLRAQAKEFYEKFLKKRFNHEVLKVINELTAEGYQIVLVSGTLDFIGQEIAENIGASSLYATTLSYKDNICLGYINKELLGNKHLILDRIQQNKKGMMTVYTITDNKSDMKLLKQSTFKCIVSTASDVSFWKKRLTDEFKLITV